MYHAATHSRPLVSQFIWTGLTSSGNCSSLAKTLALSPGWSLSLAIDCSAVRIGQDLSGLGPGWFDSTFVTGGRLESSGWIVFPWAAAQTTLSRLAVRTSRCDISSCLTLKFDSLGPPGPCSYSILERPP